MMKTCVRCGGEFRTSHARTQWCSRDCVNADRARLAAENLEAHFWARVNKTDDCWLWMGSRNALRYGYGVYGKGGKYAHRLSWEIHHGRPIPPGMNILHRCDNPPCVNPDHLFLGTQADNVVDMVRKGRARPWGARLDGGKRKGTSRKGLIPAGKPLKCPICGIEYLRTNWMSRGLGVLPNGESVKMDTHILKCLTSPAGEHAYQGRYQGAETVQAAKEALS
jgi:hypothetical protein